MAVAVAVAMLSSLASPASSLCSTQDTQIAFESTPRDPPIPASHQALMQENLALGLAHSETANMISQAETPAPITQLSAEAQPSAVKPVGNLDARPIFRPQVEMGWLDGYLIRGLASRLFASIGFGPWVSGLLTWFFPCSVYAFAVSSTPYARKQAQARDPARARTPLLHDRFSRVQHDDVSIVDIIQQQHAEAAQSSNRSGSDASALPSSATNDAGGGPYDIGMDVCTPDFVARLRSTSLSVVGTVALRRRESRVLGRGLVYLQNWLSLELQAHVIECCRQLSREGAGFTRPEFENGARMKLRMMCLGKGSTGVRWRIESWAGLGWAGGGSRGGMLYELAHLNVKMYVCVCVCVRERERERERERCAGVDQSPELVFALLKNKTMRTSLHCTLARLCDNIAIAAVPADGQAPSGGTHSRAATSMPPTLPSPKSCARSPSRWWPMPTAKSSTTIRTRWSCFQDASPMCAWSTFTSRRGA